MTNIELESENQYEKILQEIDELLREEKIDESNERIKSFIEARLNRIREITIPHEISTESNGFISGYIHPDSKVYRSRLFDPFMLDDDESYVELLKGLHALKNSPTWKDRPLRSIVPAALLYSIANYFGINYSVQNEPLNRQFYMDHTSVDSDPIHLRELKGKGLAVCPEIAGLAQNFATFLGTNSNLVLGECKLDEKLKEEFHAYNILETERGRFIVDFTNPVLIRDGENSIVNFAPSVYPISEEDFEKIKSHQSIEVKHTNYLQEEGQTLPSEEVTRIYGG